MPAWSDDILELARQLYEGGKHTTAQIARAVGKTRNAVIGISHRKHWINPNPPIGGRAAIVGPTAAPKRRVAHRAYLKPPILAQKRPVAPVSMDFLGVGLMELEKGQCRYPHGEGRGIKFCGQPAEQSYCAVHQKLCYYPVNEQRRISKTDLFRL